MDTDGCTIDMLQPITMQAPPGDIPDGMKVTALADPDPGWHVPASCPDSANCCATPRKAFIARREISTSIR